VLYLAWIVAPALHQIHLYYEYRAEPCQSCPCKESSWRILSHSPDEPCSDPDHHHHHRPVHDPDHCLSCQLSAEAVAVLPSIAAPLHVVQVARFLPSWGVAVPLSPALLALSARAPPAPLSA
jgi:hypothetical protein